ncbi:MAG: SDR family NAD(P)-dependent oxidoreductase [Cyanobacteria bacterium J06649_4]
MVKRKLSGTTVVLTGASRGIGLEISRMLAEQKANLIGIARSQQQLEQWEKEMSDYGIQTEKILFDLSKIAHLSNLAEQVKQCAYRLSDGQIDILINNAGIEIYRAFGQYTPKEIETIIQVNLAAPMTLTRLLLPQLSAQGQIVNMASLAGKKGHPYDSAYAASKAGLLMWSHSLRQEMAQSEQAISVICPGYVVGSGMLTDTGIPAPLLAGRSSAKTVAKAVIEAIQYQKAEVIVNQDLVTEIATRLLLAAEQLFPRLADFSNHRMGITRLNQQRIRPHAEVL